MLYNGRMQLLVPTYPTSLSPGVVAYASAGPSFSLSPSSNPCSVRTSDPPPACASTPIVCRPGISSRPTSWACSVLSSGSVASAAISLVESRRFRSMTPPRGMKRGETATVPGVAVLGGR